jgi:hypothetical protein
MFLMAKIKEPPKGEEISLFCSLCGKETDDGYLCRERGIILCPKCQDKFSMEHCPHVHGEHKHIKWPGIKDRNIECMDEVIRISNGAHAHL